MLVRMLHRFTDAHYETEYPLVSSIYRRIDRKEQVLI